MRTPLRHPPPPSFHPSALHVRCDARTAFPPCLFQQLPSQASLVARLLRDRRAPPRAARSARRPCPGSSGSPPEAVGRRNDASCPKQRGAAAVVAAAAATAATAAATGAAVVGARATWRRVPSVPLTVRVRWRPQPRCLSSRQQERRGGERGAAPWLAPQILFVGGQPSAPLVGGPARVVHERELGVGAPRRPPPLKAGVVKPGSETPGTLAASAVAYKRPVPCLSSSPAVDRPPPPPTPPMLFPKSP